MLNVIFTLDYEIHGNGEGSPHLLMVEPTRRMMRSFERYGARLTIMADVAEIGRFKHYAAAHGEDRFHASAIEDQLREALGGGHDVQLHVHSGYFEAVFENGRWVQDGAQRNLPGLGYERLHRIIGDGKSYLEELLRPVAPGYSCVAFRSAYWAMQPSRDIVRALRDHGIRFDTSVFKYGSRSGAVNFDYSGAFSRLVPWPVDEDDVCVADPDGDLWEVPIYCENRPLWHFLSWMRLYQVWQTKIHPLTKGAGGGDEIGEASVRPAEKRVGSPLGRLAGKAAFLLGKHALKMDFNQCSGGQLARTLAGIEKEYENFPHPLPLVLIGHSKLFTPRNEKELEVFLERVAGDEKCRFATFRDLDTATMRKAFEHEYAGGAVPRPQEGAQPGAAK